MTTGPFGVDAAALADLPNDLRRRVLEALSEADTAMRSGDEDRMTNATTRVNQLHAEVQDWRAGHTVTKAIKTARPIRKRADVLKMFSGDKR
jgi:hypothetical protein